MSPKSHPVVHADRRAGLVLKLFGALAAAIVLVIALLNLGAVTMEARARHAWTRVEGMPPLPPPARAPAPKPSAPAGSSSAASGPTGAAVPANREIPLPPEDAAPLAGLDGMKDQEFWRFNYALTRATREEDPAPDPAMAAWLADHARAIDAVVEHLLAQEQAPEWSGQFWRTPYARVFRMLTADAVLTARAGDLDRAERELEAQRRLWSWNQQDWGWPLSVELAAVRHVRPRDPAWLDTLDVEGPRKRMLAHARLEVTEDWMGPHPALDPTLEALYEDMTPGTRGVVDALVLRPVRRMRLARKAQRVTRVLAELQSRNECLPGDAPTAGDDDEASLEAQYRRQWDHAMVGQADVLLTRAVLRASRGELEPETSPCPDWRVEVRDLGDGRIRVSLRGSARDVSSRWRSTPSDFEFTRR